MVQQILRIPVQGQDAYGCIHRHVPAAVISYTGSPVAELGGGMIYFQREIYIY
jgi:hypothetical protein